MAVPGAGLGGTLPPVSESKHLDVDGPVHYVDHGGRGRVMVLVHGLGGSHLNWMHVAERLADRHRVVAVDLPGFGLTPPEGRRSTIGANRDLVHRFAQEISPEEPVALVGNSMGGLVAMRVAARHADRVSHLVLVDPALPIVDTGAVNRDTLERLVMPLVPGLGTAWMRRYHASTTPEEQYVDTMRVVCADPAMVPAAGREASIAMIERRREMEWAIPAFAQASRSIAGTLAQRGRFRRMVDRIACPTLLIHGSEDRIVSPGSALRLAERRPDWRFELLEGVGHVPQIEVPDTFVGLVDGWLPA